jgi:dihydroorotate dehydrogenase (fumarate)
MSNLETSYMGILLKSPIILGACELTSKTDVIKRAEQEGVGAVVYKSIFEEQIQMDNLMHDELLEEYNDIHAEMITNHPNIDRSEIEHYLHQLRKAKESVSIPVIASLNAVNESSWIRYASLIEETGVDGIELNLYQTPTRFDLDGTTIEKQQIDLVSKIKSSLSIPVSVKLSQDYTNILNFAQQLDSVGVDAMVMFNAFFQPDIEIEKEKHRKSFNLSRRGDYKKSLRYAGMLHGRIKADICSSLGVFNGEDVIKLLLSGASCVQVVSAVYKYGTSVISEINRTVSDWMERKGYNTIEDFEGKLSDSVLNKNDSVIIYKRAQYIDLLLNSDTVFGEKL